MHAASKRCGGTLSLSSIVNIISIMWFGSAAPPGGMPPGPVMAPGAPIMPPGGPIMPPPMPPGPIICGIPPAFMPGAATSGPLDSTCSVCFRVASAAFRSSNSAAEPLSSSATSVRRISGAKVKADGRADLTHMVRHAYVRDVIVSSACFVSSCCVELRLHE